MNTNKWLSINDIMLSEGVVKDLFRTLISLSTKKGIMKERGVKNYSIFLGIVYEM